MTVDGFRTPIAAAILVAVQRNQLTCLDQIQSTKEKDPVCRCAACAAVILNLFQDPFPVGKIIFSLTEMGISAPPRTTRRLVFLHADINQQDILGAVAHNLARGFEQRRLDVIKGFAIFGNGRKLTAIGEYKELRQHGVA